MALDYATTADLMKDEAFIGRVQVACLQYATYIYEEPTSTPAHSTRVRWCQQTMASPVTSAVQVMPAVVIDPAVQEAGAAITDDALQAAVETAVNKML
jgi:hypothetical protein